MGEREMNQLKHILVLNPFKALPNFSNQSKRKPRLQPLFRHDYRLVLILIWRWTRESKKKKKRLTKSRRRLRKNWGNGRKEVFTRRGLAGRSETS